MSVETRYIIQTPDGRSFGPAGLAEILEWARQGSLPSQSVAIEEATGQRMPIAMLPGLLEAVPRSGVEFFIPKNRDALISYYVGFASLVLLVLCGLLAVISGAVGVYFGIRGLRYAKDYPEAKGGAHAWTGIIMNSVCAMLGVLCGAYLLFVFGYVALGA